MRESPSPNDCTGDSGIEYGGEGGRMEDLEVKIGRREMSNI